MQCPRRKTNQDLPYNLFFFFFHFVIQCYFWSITSILRHEQPRGSGTSGARVQDALSPGLPHLTAWADAAVLEKRCWRAAHLWILASLPGGLFYSHWASVPAWGQPLKPGSSKAVTENLGPSWLGPIKMYSFLSSGWTFWVSPWHWNISLSFYHMWPLPQFLNVAVKCNN